MKKSDSKQFSLATTSILGQPPSAVISVENLSKFYQQGSIRVEVLSKLNFEVLSGEQIAIVGASGSGKSTLLHLIGGLDSPSSGELDVVGKRMSSLGQRGRGKLRNANIGFVYQFHHLLPEFSAIENVAMPLLIGGVQKLKAKAQAIAMLEKVGLADRLPHKPSELSGGERQRAAIARALVTKPKIVLADEPTGNLDEQTAESVYQLMMSLNKEVGTSFLVVTHDMQLAKRMNRIMLLSNGSLKNYGSK